MNSKYEPRQSVKETAYKEGKLDSELATGPVEVRTCRDFFCFFTFILCWVASIVVAKYAFANGDPHLLLRPTDASGNTCGYPGSPLEAFPYIYFMDYNNLNSTVCVRSCPAVTGAKKPSKLMCHPNNLTSDCEENTYDSSKQKVHIYDTMEFASIACVPSTRSSSEGAVSVENIDKALTTPLLTTFYNDLQATQSILVVTPLVAVVLGFIFMCFLRNCTGCVVWGLITTLLIGLVSFGLLCFHTLSNPDNSTRFGIFKNTSEATLQFLAYGSWALASIYLLALVCLCNRLRLTIAVLRCASEFVREVPTAILAPVVSIVLFGGYLIYWLVVSVYLYSTGTIKNNADGYAMKEITRSSTEKLFIVLHVFHGYWNFFLVLGLTQFVLAYMCCKWYFYQGRRLPLSNMLSGAFCSAFYYHLGSIAFGSLLLASISTIKAVLAYFYNQLKTLEGNAGSRFAEYLYRCIFCFLNFFENFIQFLTKHSYTQIAMSGKSFYGSAKDAFYLSVRNSGRFGLVHELGKLFVAFGELCVTLVISVVTYFVITKVPYFQGSVQYPLLPVAFAGVIGYVIGAVFMMVYGVAADAIVHCYCIDEELNFSNKYAPNILREFIGRHATGHTLVRDSELSASIARV